MYEDDWTHSTTTLAVKLFYCIYLGVAKQNQKQGEIWQKASIWCAVLQSRTSAIIKGLGLFLHCHSLSFWLTKVGRADSVRVNARSDKHQCKDGVAHEVQKCLWTFSPPMLTFIRCILPMPRRTKRMSADRRGFLAWQTALNAGNSKTL